MNSIDPDIQLTWDTPSNNQDRRMPVLDLKLWMEQNQEGENRIRFSYYENAHFKDSPYIFPIYSSYVPYIFIRVPGPSSKVESTLKGTLYFPANSTARI